MAKYVLVYKAHQAFDWTTLPAEEVNKVMASWTDWIASLGEALQSFEVFKFGGRSVSKSGTNDADNLLTGHAIINAKDFAAAEELAKGAPNVISDKGSIQIYEALDLSN